MRICCSLVLVAVGCAAQENTRSISGTVIDPSGASIPNVTVTLSGSTTVEVKADNQGKFLFSSLEPGKYKVTFQRAGFARTILDLTLDAAPIFLGEVVLQLGYQPYIIEVTKENGWSRVPSACLGSICGSVRYGSAGVTNAIVALQLSGEPHRLKTTRTDASGIFQLNNVQAGLYDLVIEAKGFKPATIDSIGLRHGGQITLPLVQLQRLTTRVR